MIRRSLALLGGAGILHALSCVAGCSGRIDTGVAASSTPPNIGGGGADASAPSSPAASGPYRITCSVYHRDLGAGVTEHGRSSLVFMTDEPSAQEIELPGTGIAVRASLAVAADLPELVELGIAFPRSSLEQHFRLARDRMPPYELIGFHGFTGLNYVSTPGSSVDVQFVCEASPRGEERPKPFPPPGGPPGDAPDPPAPPPPTPFRVRCETTVGEAADAQTDSFVLEGPTERTLTLGDRTVELSLQDSRYEGRGFIVRIPGTLQQLYQLDPSKPLTDTTHGPGGLTGRTVLRPAAPDGGTAPDGARVVSLACGAAPS